MLGDAALAHLRTGHSHLTHSCLMADFDQTLCPFRNVPLTVQHILLTRTQDTAAENNAFPHLAPLPHPPRDHFKPYIFNSVVWKTCTR